MDGENRPLVTDEPVEIEKQPVQVQDLVEENVQSFGGDLENIPRFYKEEPKVCQTIFYINKINKHLISTIILGQRTLGSKRNHFGTERVIFVVWIWGLVWQYVD